MQQRRQPEFGYASRSARRPPVRRTTGGEYRSRRRRRRRRVQTEGSCSLRRAVILPCSHDGERHAPAFFWSRLREFPLKSCANHRPVYPSTARVLGSSLVRSAAAVLLYERPRGENLLEQPNERTAHSAWNFFFLLPRLTCSMDDGP